METISTPEVQMLIKVGNIVDSQFKNQLFSPTIIEDVIATLPQGTQTDLAYEAVKNVVFNRQLMHKRFM